MDKKELLFSFKTKANSEIALTITHKPTGLSVSSRGASKIFLQEMLLPMLENKIERKT